MSLKPNQIAKAKELASLAGHAISVFQDIQDGFSQKNVEEKPFMEQVRDALDVLAIPMPDINNRELIDEKFKTLAEIYRPETRKAESSPSFDRVVYAYETLKELNGW